MNSTDDLFADQGGDCAPQSDRLEVVAGKVVASMNKPSAAQKRFNTLMAKVDAEQALEQTLRRVLETHGHAHRLALATLHDESVRLNKRMVLFLDQCLQAPSQPKGLSAKQRQQALRILLGLCESLLPLQDAEIEAVWRRHGPDPEEDAELRQDAMAQAQAMAESYLGADFAQGRTFESPEEVLRAAMEHEWRQAQAQQEKRAAKRAQRKAEKGPSAREVAAEQKQLDAQNALRTVFRQLASALHPDREPDEQARRRKTALMSEVNAAYERKDLNALLRLQLQCELVDASKAAALSEDRLKAMCNVLAEQIKTLESGNHALRLEMDADFGYPAFLPFKEAEFQACMQEGRDVMEDDLAQMREDLKRVQDMKQLKAWLKLQTQANKDLLGQEADLDLDDLLYDLMRTR